MNREDALAACATGKFLASADALADLLKQGGAIYVTPLERAKSIDHDNLRCKHDWLVYDGQCNDCVAEAIEAAVAEEREACAKIAESGDHDATGRVVQLEIAAAIRARGES